MEKDSELTPADMESLSLSQENDSLPLHVAGESSQAPDKTLEDLHSNPSPPAEDVKEKSTSSHSNASIPMAASTCGWVQDSSKIAGARNESSQAAGKGSSDLIMSEMEFDPDNVPRDPESQGSRANSYNSVSSEDCTGESAGPACDSVPVTLCTLPVEILLHICEFLEAHDISSTLCQVCQAFQELFTNQVYWRTRIRRRWPKKYPAIDYEGIDWQAVCVERERCHRVWSNPEEHMEHFTYTDALFAAVDVVHLMQDGRLLAAGSRDRYLTLLDLTKYDVSSPSTKKDMKLHCINKAHNGWIWSMASLDNQLYTGSWDTKIKVWDMERNCELLTTYKCKSAVLGLHVEQDFIVAGGFDKKVYFIDPRRRGVLTTKRWHRQPVLCIVADQDYVITGSEDKTFSIFDRRADLVFKVVQVENYPLDVSYHNNQLWFGDKVGNLNLMDTTFGKFEIVESYKVGHTDKVTGVIHTEGAIYTASSDKTIKVLQPSRDPAPITTLHKHSNGLAGIAYQNGVLASAGCDISVGVWRPKRDWGWSVSP